MLKKNLIFILCLMHNAVDTYAQPSQQKILSEKSQSLYQLQDIAEILNKIKPIGNYFLTVPPFIELTTQDIQQFLAAVPSGLMDQHSPKKQPLSMLAYIQLLWGKVVTQAQQHKKITPLMRDYLIEIRAAIESAFQHDLLNAPMRTHIRSFLERQKEQRNELIIRTASQYPHLNIKSASPLSMQNLNSGLIKTLQSCFSEQAILEQISRNTLSTAFNLDLIIQSVIKEDADGKELLVSGVSCSYDTLSNIPNVITIKALFGDTKAICKANVAADTYYVHDKIIYPIIRKKLNRFILDSATMRSFLTPNDQNIQYNATLNPQAVHEIARATKTLEEIYQSPVCITFIKRSNTIYLIKIQTPDLTIDTNPTFFDTLYTEELPLESRAVITPIKPSHTLTVIKKRHKIILAPNARTFIHMLNKRKKPEEVVIGLLKKMPPAHSKEAQLLNDINIPIIWSPDFEQIRSWIDDRKFPLIFDMQQKLAFQFTRCRGFCTLFQAIQNGICAHPIMPQLSILPEFMLALKPNERDMLKPDEHFSGVPPIRLFELLRTGTQITAESALNTILFRLQRKILHEYITKKECAMTSAPFDSNPCELMELMYTYVERVAFQLKMLLNRLHNNAKITHKDTLERIFLINILQAVILQQPDDQIAHSQSFLHLS